jgi:hypothetical protein
MSTQLLRTHKLAENCKQSMAWISIADNNNNKNDEQMHLRGSVEMLGERLPKSYYISTEELAWLTIER